MAGSTLSLLIEPHQRNANLRSVLGKSERYMFARYTELPFPTLQRAAEMVDFSHWARTRPNAEVAPKTVVQALNANV
jgi:hypothetical protein